MEIFIDVDNKKKELNELGLTPEAKRVLDKKFRLEWSYHSNHMEGNTLTYGETQMLLFFGKATGDHEKREYDEMEAHDVAVKMVEEWAKDDQRDITEADVRQLNKIILVRPYWKDSVTPDGKPSRKEITPGSYKTTPNSVQLKNGLIHEYASPQETPILMAELMDSLIKAKEKKQHPVMTAVFFHHQFVAIHPFDDGNGRVARLLTNYILMKSGYPPVVIKTENKPEYLTVLQKADGRDLEPFMHFLVKELHWSLDISIKAAKGESIDEPGDLDKQIELLKRRLDGNDLISQKKDNKVLELTVNESVFPILEQFEKKCEKLKDLFLDYHRLIQCNIGGNTRDIGLRDSSWIELKNRLKAHMDRQPNGLLNSIGYSYQLKGYKKSLTHQYMSSRAEIAFNEFNYAFVVDGDHTKQLVFSYDKILDEKEINQIVKIMVDKILDQIKNASGLNN
jgi:Fic family protein